MASIKKTVLLPKPRWVEPLLQGLAFWVGYKRQYYGFYHLTEGALVGESAQLIFSHLSEKEKLVCEVMYKTLHSSHKGNQRLDLAIFEKASDECICAIEVKRYESSKKLINDDLIRLSKLKKLKSSIRCFLIIISQGELPKEYSDDKGKAVRKDISPSPDFNAYVRRFCKALSSFKISSKASSTCIIEVL